MRGKPWTQAQLDMLLALYPTHSAQQLKGRIGRSVTSIYAKAANMGVRTSREAIANMARERSSKPDHGGRKTAFKPGQVSWNKGIKGSTGLHPNSRATQFQPGQLNGRATHLVAPLGTFRINPDGALERKVSEISGAPHLRWHPVSRLVWEAANGKVPTGHIVTFRPGTKTNVLEEITLDKLELITRAERMRRNSMHTIYPPELARVTQLRGALTRQINRQAQEKRTS